jgi:hypothetical protein
LEVFIQTLKSQTSLPHSLLNSWSSQSTHSLTLFWIHEAAKALTRSLSSEFMKQPKHSLTHSLLNSWSSPSAHSLTHSPTRLFVCLLLLRYHWMFFFWWRMTRASFLSSSRVCNLMYIFLQLGPSVFLHILDTWYNITWVCCFWEHTCMQQKASKLATSSSQGSNVP